VIRRSRYLYGDYSYDHIQLYLYLFRAYARFRMVGECLSLPMVLQIQTHSFCNGECTICPYPSTSRELEQGFMERDLFDKIVSEMRSATRLSMVGFASQNEPLLDERLFDWIRHIKSMCPDKICMVTTNGEQLDRFSMEEVRQSGVDRIVVSLNAQSEETYEKINVGLDFNRVMNNVSSLLADQSLRPRVELSFRLVKENSSEVRSAVRYWKAQGVRTRVMGIANRAGSLVDYEAVRLGNDSQGIAPHRHRWRRAMSSLRGVLGCEIPFHRMDILFNGETLMCCQDWKRAVTVGNAATASIEDIWNSPKMNDFRKLILRKRYEQITTCRECSMAP
jgi:radical SAM protein with 4Fe4S-binding SPASM domain